jgi:hypothetical protein
MQEPQQEVRLTRLIPHDLRAIVGFTNKTGSFVTGCDITSGCSVLTASLRARSCPISQFSPLALVCKSFRRWRPSRNAGERALYAAVNEVKAVSPPPDAGTSTTQKKEVGCIWGEGLVDMSQVVGCSWAQEMAEIAFMHR